MAEYIDIVSIKSVVSSGALKVEVNEIGNILLIDPRSKESVKIGCLADVAPVRHGRWEYHLMPIACKCSACGYRTSNSALRYNHMNYCPNCGAKMDEDVQE